MKVKPMDMLLMMPAGRLSRHQQDVIVRNPCVAGSGSVHGKSVDLERHGGYNAGSLK